MSKRGQVKLTQNCCLAKKRPACEVCEVCSPVRCKKKKCKLPSTNSNPILKSVCLKTQCLQERVVVYKKCKWPLRKVKSSQTTEKFGEDKMTQFPEGQLNGVSFTEQSDDYIEVGMSKVTVNEERDYGIVGHTSTFKLTDIINDVDDEVGSTETAIESAETSEQNTANSANGIMQPPLPLDSHILIAKRLNKDSEISERGKSLQIADTVAEELRSSGGGSSETNIKVDSSVAQSSKSRNSQLTNDSLKSDAESGSGSSSQPDDSTIYSTPFSNSPSIQRSSYQNGDPVKSCTPCNNAPCNGRCGIQRCSCQTSCPVKSHTCGGNTVCNGPCGFQRSLPRSCDPGNSCARCRYAFCCARTCDVEKDAPKKSPQTKNTVNSDSPRESAANESTKITSESARPAVATGQCECKGSFPQKIDHEKIGVTADCSCKERIGANEKTIGNKQKTLAKAGGKANREKILSNQKQSGSKKKDQIKSPPKDAQKNKKKIESPRSRRNSTALALKLEEDKEFEPKSAISFKEKSNSNSNNPSSQRSAKSNASEDSKETVGNSLSESRYESIQSKIAYSSKSTLNKSAEEDELDQEHSDEADEEKEEVEEEEEEEQEQGQEQEQEQGAANPCWCNKSCCPNSFRYCCNYYCPARRMCRCNKCMTWPATCSCNCCCFRNR